LPPLESFWNALPEFFAWLAGGARPAMPQPYPLAAGEQVIRRSVGTLSGPGMVSSALEIIRFAAANRLTVEIDYVKEDGERTTREIEAYSLRKIKAGAVVLHSFDLNRNDHRSYRTERIQGARATGRVFTPRYAVELTPGEPQFIMPAARIASPLNVGARLGKPTRRSSARRTFGPTYVYQCPVCSKKFRRPNQNSALRAHKSPDGWDCSGRTGYLLEVR
jgi:hypothetical protein